MEIEEAPLVESRIKLTESHDVGLGGIPFDRLSGVGGEC